MGSDEEDQSSFVLSPEDEKIKSDEKIRIEERNIDLKPQMPARFSPDKSDDENKAYWKMYSYFRNYKIQIFEFSINKNIEHTINLRFTRDFTLNIPFAPIS